MTIAGGGQTLARVYRQTVPFSESVTARGRRQGDGGRLGPCTRIDDGATTEGDGERAARHLRAACRVYTLRPPPPYAPDKRGATPHPLPCAARALRYATGKGAPIPACGLQGYRPRALRPSRGGADRGDGDSGRPPLCYGSTTRSSEQGAHNSPARTAVALPPLGIYGRMCLSASFAERPRLPALVDGRPSTSQGTRYGATVPGGDRLPRSVLLSPACARIASDCLRVLLALDRVSVPLVDGRPSTSSQTRAHPCAGMARVTLARGSPPARQDTRDSGTASRRLRPACGGFGLDAAPPPASVTDKGARVRESAGF